MTVYSCRCGRTFRNWQGRVVHGRHSPDCRVQFVDRFWAKVRKDCDCWEWIGARTGPGYGAIGLGSDRVIAAHRASYEMSVGPIPVGLRVLHRCDNPPCIRPEHLWLGTAADNTADMMAKGRNRRG